MTGLEQHIPALRRYAWALLRNDGDADDLVQDCLVRAIERTDSRRSEGDMRAWLFSILHNLSISLWRRRKVRAAITADLHGRENAASVPAPQSAAAELKEALRMLDGLAEEQRQTLLLIAVEGFEYAEVARIMNVPVGTVMSRLSRARDRLRERTYEHKQPVLRRIK